MLRTLLVVAAFLGTASANSKIAKPPSAKTRTAQLCLSDFAVAGTDPGILAADSTGTFAFNSGVFDCASFDPVAGTYSRRLGELGWSCEWAPTSQGPAQLIPCDGLLSVASSAKVARRLPLSTIFFSFWIAEANLQVPELLTAGNSLVAPTAIRSTGSWGKVDAISTFGWTFDAVSNQLFFDVAYYKSGFNPAYAGK